MKPEKLNIIIERPAALLRFRRFDFRLIARITGMLLIYLSVGMALPLAASLYSRDGAQFALALSAVMILLLGLLFRNILGRKAGYELHEKESFWITVIIWLVVPIAGTPINMLNLPKGCAFTPRCTQRCDECSAAVPELRKIGENHWAACPFI